MAELFVHEPLEVFGAADLARLRQRLGEQDAATVLVCLDDPEQLQFRPDGTSLRGGLRLTGSALQQVAGLLAGGLALLVRDLARTPVAAVEALTVFNLVARRRFGAVTGWQAVTDSRAKHLVGVVGASYQRLSSAELLEAAEGALEGGTGKSQFLEASLCGRSLSLRYRSVLPVILEEPLAGPGVDRWHRGLYFGNSEVGDGAVRACPLLWRERDGGTALGALEGGGCVRHQGKSFRLRLGRMLSSAAVAGLEDTVLRGRLRLLRERSLGITGDGEGDSARLARLLHGRALPLAVARKLVRSALGRGADDAAGLPPVLDRMVWARRNCYDLLCALMREARALPPVHREQTERLAYRLITGKFLAGEPRRS